MKTLMRKKLAINLLFVTLLALAAGFNQPQVAQAQTPSGTGKTITAVLLGTATAPDEGSQQNDLHADEPAPDGAAKIPGVHKVSDITLKRGQIG